MGHGRPRRNAEAASLASRLVLVLNAQRYRHETAMQHDLWLNNPRCVRLHLSSIRASDTATKSVKGVARMFNKFAMATKEKLANLQCASLQYRPRAPGFIAFGGSPAPRSCSLDVCALISPRLDPAHHRLVPHDRVLGVEAVVVLSGEVEHLGRHTCRRHAVRMRVAPCLRARSWQARLTAALQRGESGDALRLDEPKVLGAVDDKRRRLPLVHLGGRRASHVGARGFLGSRLERSAAEFMLPREDRDRSVDLAGAARAESPSHGSRPASNASMKKSSSVEK